MNATTVVLYRSFALISVLGIILLSASAALAQSDADAAWNRVKDCTDHIDVELFIMEYPDSSHVGAAEACLADMGGNEPIQKGKISNLLAECDGHLAANRLLTGAEGTAYFCYQKVLLQDPSNTEAAAGLTRIADRYASLARQEIEQQNPEKAQMYLEFLTTVKSNDPRIPDLQDALSATSVVVGQPADDDFDVGVAAQILGDFETAFHIFRGLAQNGHAAAQFELGVMYREGEGVPQDAAEAAHWYRLAADQGLAEAQNNLGFMYQEGEGVPRDAATAVHWYRLAADQGSASAQHNLGVMYREGEGVPQDAAEAAHWYRLAADQGLAAAQNTLGVMYQEGEGVPRDAVGAVRWYRRAAEQGNARAQSNLGRMYYFGEGVPRDAATAVRWVRMAADQGQAEAQAALGFLYYEGEGVPQDDLRAYAYFNLAISQGLVEAAEWRDLVESRMSSGDISKARDLTRQLESQINGN